MENLPRSEEGYSNETDVLSKKSLSPQDSGHNEIDRNPSILENRGYFQDIDFMTYLTVFRVSHVEDLHYKVVCEPTSSLTRTFIS